MKEWDIAKSERNREGWLKSSLDSLGVEGDQYELRQANAEVLPFSDDAFDMVYSWGVLHHSPNTAGALAEVRRVLRPGGQMKIMV